MKLLVFGMRGCCAHKNSIQAQRLKIIQERFCNNKVLIRLCTCNELKCMASNFTVH